MKKNNKENIIGKCECLNYDYKYHLLRVLKESAEHKKDLINKIESTSEKVTKDGMSPDYMIDQSRKFIEKTEKTEEAIRDTPLCKRLAKK